MNKSMVLTAVIMLSAGLGLGYWLSPVEQEGAKATMSMGDDPVDADGGETPATGKVLFYRNAMNPSVTSPVPAKDAMGMDYVPVYADGAGNAGNAGTVSIDPIVIQNIGVRTAIAKKSDLSRTVRAVGRVAFDEERMARLHPKVEGWIEDIRVDKTGETVKKGDVMVSIYSPRLVSTQQEYLLALNNLQALKDSPFDEIKLGAEQLLKSSRQRLLLLDVAEHEIVELEKTQQIKRVLHIHTPVPGTVIRVGSRKGQYVTAKTELYMVVDLEQVWVYADIYEYELPWVKIGDEVDMTLTGVPGRVFKGELAYIYPYSESKTRTTKVRVVFDNSESLLRPDMFAEVSIRSDRQEGVIVIPAESVVRSGDFNQVFVVRAPGKFEPRRVELGFESKGEVAILDGVEEGDEVVTSAQFLLDSESKLGEATAKMMESLQNKAPPQQSESPEMDSMEKPDYD